MQRAYKVPRMCSLYCVLELHAISRTVWMHMDLETGELGPSHHAAQAFISFGIEKV